jgi:signal transduction histidine kinase
MRSILGVLRDPGDGRVPHPGLDQIGDLAAKARDAGLVVELDAGTPAQPLPSAVDGAAYRILQESITNVIRHVGPTRVTVSMEHGLDALEVRVVDEGPRDAHGGSARPKDGSPAPGRGILGMRERCRLLGGELTARPRPGGGFEVTARLPLDPAGSVR